MIGVGWGAELGEGQRAAAHTLQTGAIPSTTHNP